jgi:3-dehydroquinate synthase
MTKQNLRRPLLETGNPGQEIDRLLEQRAEGYRQFKTLDTSTKDIETLVSDLVELITLEEQNNDWQKPVTSQFPVHFPGGKYRVSVGWNMLPHLDDYIPLSGQSIVITDTNVGPVYSQEIPADKVTVAVTLPAGEQHKSLQSIRDIYDQLLDAGIDRRGTIIALGGGVIGDMAGFAAATYMRGIRFIQCPTTVLSMVDASVGGKTGVDLPQGKNLVGAFKQPAAVVADLATLKTLPRSEVSGGMAEIVKHGIIASPQLLTRLSTIDWLVDDDNEQKLPGYQYEANGKFSAGHELHKLIVEAILIKRDVVESDPFESNQRKMLNLGHTFAHAIEQVSGYQVSHGNAVALGLVAAANLSARLSHCKVDFQQYIEEILIRLGLPIRIPSYLPIQSIISAMGNDKKISAGRLNFVLVRQAGDVFISDQASVSDISQTLESVRHND